MVACQAPAARVRAALSEYLQRIQYSHHDHELTWCFSRRIAAAVGAGALVVVAALYKWTADTPTPAPPGSTPLKADSVSGNEIDNTPGAERFTGSKLGQREAQGKKSWTSTAMAKENNRPHTEEWHQHHDGDESTPNMVVKSAAAIPNSKKTAKRVDGRTE